MFSEDKLIYSFINSVNKTKLSRDIESLKEPYWLIPRALFNIYFAFLYVHVNNLALF